MTDRQPEARQFPLVMLMQGALWCLLPPLRGGVGAPLAIRLTVEAMQSLTVSDWQHARTTSTLRWTLRELRSRLWPDVTPPKPGRIVKGLDSVRSAWRRWPTLSEWQDMGDARTGFWRAVDLDMADTEAAGSRLDSEIVLRVTPPWAGERFTPGAPLASWGARSARTYNLLLLCGATWAHGDCVQIENVGLLSHPTSKTTNQPQLQSRGLRALADLVEADVLRVEDGVIERGSAYMWARCRR